MKNKIVKNVKLIKMATVAVFFVSMAFNVAMVTSSTNAGKSGLSLSGLKAMVVANGESRQCYADGTGCPMHQICRSGQCVGGQGCFNNMECDFGQSCIAGICSGGHGCQVNGQCPFGTACRGGGLGSGEHCVRVRCQDDFDCGFGRRCVHEYPGAPGSCVPVP